MEKLIVFDLDGTLINTLDDLADACNHVLQCHGRAPYPVEEYRYFVGNGADVLMQRIAPDLKEEELPMWRGEFDDYYGKNSLVKTAPYAGINTMLNSLVKQGYSLAILSNKPDPFVRELAAVLFPNIPFSSVLGHRPGVPTKPDPTSLSEIINEFPFISLENIYYIGDSDADMQLAKAAGVWGIGVTWGFRDEDELRLHGADFIVHHPDEIVKLIKNT